MEHMVPFHISTIKHCTLIHDQKSGVVYFRIYFKGPVPIMPNNKTRYGAFMSITELTYKNNGGRHLSLINDQVRTLQNQYKINRLLNRDEDTLKVTGCYW